MLSMSTESWNNDNINLLRRSDVLMRCAFSNSTLHRLINSGDFPTPIQLSPRSVAWIEHEVNDWIKQRILTTRTLKNGGSYE
tara:strand:+ start:20649 stop:20894 length:246 start_codon:yes stop_codon:yes gene_type:complete